ncbi:integrase arm-type DNA-binding domain-containing protein [uncultured Psychrobacter sp.]|uniref:tyrosine-type recombinase/integrase n=1 Tax=uncultured Psychrobacter sp. TaxID=259303 RepID=UPI0030DB20C6
MQIHSKKEINKLAIKTSDYLVGVSGVKGLSVRVRPHGTKEYVMRYKHPHNPGSRPRMVLGNVEELSLDEAQRQGNAILSALAEGVDPKTIRLQDSINKYSYLKNATFNDMVTAWKKHQMSGKKQYAKSTQAYWDLCLNYMIEAVGDLRMDEISSEVILAVCEGVQNNDNKATFVGASVRLYTDKVFKFALARGLCKKNAAEPTRGELAAAGSGNHLPAIIKPEAFAELLKDMDNYEGAAEVTLAAINLLPYVFVRSIDIRSMLWEDINWEQALWEFSPVKGEGREDMVDSLVVPLATQVVRRLKAVQAITGQQKYVFSSLRSSKNPFISKATLIQAFHRMGYKGKHCPHGFRASAKTLLMEQPELRYSDTVTELQLGHKIKDTHGGAYNRLDEIDTRIKMMQDWADYIDNLKNSTDEILD